jgi:hypothetical protein
MPTLKYWDGTQFVALSTALAVGAPVEVASLGLLVTGQETVPRLFVNSNSALASGVMRFSHFTARKTESVTQVRVVTGTTPAGATPTLIRFGIYSEAANGDLTLIASTGNDTTLLSVASTRYTKNLSASVGIMAGQKYAMGFLIVTAQTAPQLVSWSNGIAGEAFTLPPSAPRLCSQLSAQSDLPSFVPVASLAQTGASMYGVILP